MDRTFPCASLYSFGSLPLLRNRRELLDTGQPIVISWALHWSERSLRLSLSFRHARFHILLDGKRDSTAKRILTAVAPTFVRCAQDDDWRQRGVLQASDQEKAAAAAAEDEVVQLVGHELPDLLQQAQARRPGPVQAAQIVAVLRSEAALPLTEPRLLLIGDMYRDLLVDQLLPLSDAAYPGVPRLDLDTNVYFQCPGLDYFRDHFLHISLHRSASAPPFDAVLKTARILPTFTETAGCTPRFGVKLAETGLFVGELDIITALPAHPNVMPAPLALLTLSVPIRNDAGSAATPRLIGWVQQRYLRPERMWTFDGDEAVMSAARSRRLLRYCHDLAARLQHLLRHGLVHCDIGWTNTLIGAPPPDDRLVVIDFEPRACYYNKDGPLAPEVLGHWTASPADDGSGQITYAACAGDEQEGEGEGGGGGKRVLRNETILADWAHMPEALERTTVFNMGWTMAFLLGMRVVAPWTARRRPAHAHHVSKAPEPGDDPEFDATEALLPPGVKMLVQQCCAYDPRQRPRMDEVVERLQHFQPGSCVTDASLKVLIDACPTGSIRGSQIVQVRDGCNVL